MEPYAWIHHRFHDFLNSTPAISEGVDMKFDKELISRLLIAYKRQAGQNYGEGSMWLGFFSAKQKEIHEIFLGEDLKKAFEILSNPKDNNLLYGLDELCLNCLAGNIEHANAKATENFDNLIRLAEAIGATRLENPESKSSWLGYRKSSPADLLKQIDLKSNTRLDFPNLYNGRVGLKTPRGLVDYRSLPSIYVALKLREYANFLSKTNFNVCEIGAGLGRTAYYANKLGIQDYTLVDVPMGAISQGYYLSKLLGLEAVVFPGEPRRNSAQIQIMHPEEYLLQSRRFDFTVNVDSITEFGETLAIRYLNKIVETSDIFLSINHEANNFTVNKLVGDNTPALRFPFWMRRGYVEEIFKFH